jgi:hypothetical protein
MVVFEYQNQVIFNVTVFDGGHPLSNGHLLLACKQKQVVLTLAFSMPTKARRFLNTKIKSYFNLTLFEGVGLGVSLKVVYYFEVFCWWASVPD